jgi:hypothetical protein
MVTPKLLPTPRASATKMASRSPGLSSIGTPTRAHAAAAMGALGDTDAATDSSSSDSDDDDWQNMQRHVAQPPRLVKPDFLAAPKYL